MNEYRVMLEFHDVAGSVTIVLCAVSAEWAGSEALDMMNYHFRPYVIEIVEV